MDPYYKDPEFSDIMFLCYNYFMEGSKLLGVLVEQYLFKCAIFEYSSTIVSYNTTVSSTVKPWQTQLAIRVLVIIKMWIMRHSESLQANVPFMERLHAFIESVPNRPQEASFFKFFKTFHQVPLKRDVEISLTNSILQTAGPTPVVLNRGLSFAPHILGDRGYVPFLSQHRHISTNREQSA